MAKRRKSIEQLEAEIRRLKVNCFWDNVGKVLSPSIKWAGLSFMAYQASVAIGYLSGKTTAADISLKAITALTPDDACANWPYWIAALSAIIGTFSISYGLNQRALRKQTVQHLEPYKVKYETLIDPNRTSSGLLNDGTTNPKDT